MRDQRHRANTLGNRLGLSVRGTDELVGVVQGVAVCQHSQDLGTTDVCEWWTFTRCTVEGLPKGLTVAPQGLWGHLADLFGARDIQVGHDLDDALRIGGSDREAVQALLGSPLVARQIHRLVHGGAQLYIHGDTVEVRRPGHHLDQAQACIVEAVELARAIRRASPSASA